MGNNNSIKRDACSLLVNNNSTKLLKRRGNLSGSMLININQSKSCVYVKWVTTEKNESNEIAIYENRIASITNFYLSPHFRQYVASTKNCSKLSVIGGENNNIDILVLETYPPNTSVLTTDYAESLNDDDMWSLVFQAAVCCYTLSKAKIKYSEQLGMKWIITQYDQPVIYQYRIGRHSSTIYKLTTNFIIRLVHFQNSKVSSSPQEFIENQNLITGMYSLSNIFKGRLYDQVFPLMLKSISVIEFRNLDDMLFNILRETKVETISRVEEEHPLYVCVPAHFDIEGNINTTFKFNEHTFYDSEIRKLSKSNQSSILSINQLKADFNL